MRRRAVLATAAKAIGVAGLAGAAALAEIVRQEWVADDDWDTVVADYSRRLVTAPTADYGAGLLAQIMVAREQIGDLGPTPDRLCAAAHLAQLFGLWLGNRDQIVGAWGWYRTAATLAGRSGDTGTEAWVRGRAASRRIYEGATSAETVAGAEHALALAPAPSLATLEAHSAMVHVHALTGRLSEGRRALAGMWKVVDTLPMNAPDGPGVRTASFANYLECRCGTRRDADRAWEQHEPVMRVAPVWHAEAQVYYALALVRDGDVADGIALALSAVGRVPDVRCNGVAVADVLRVVPPGHRGDDLDELARFAPAGPHPWETIGL